MMQWATKGTLTQGQRWAGSDLDGDTEECDGDVDTDTADWDTDGMTWGP